jgi:hypothetical protein
VAAPSRYLIAFVQARIQLGCPLAQALRFAVVLVSDGEPFTRLTLALSCDDIGLGPLALRAGNLLLRGRAFRLGSSTALARTREMIAGLGLLALSFNLLALCPPPTQSRQSDEH